ncbi:MAG: nucleotidyltransferase domain-containing protein [Candidatus Scalindua sp.]|nr:nucleotidyltransferase domain-containing protein [Candidatus Scalindua sp.]
MKKANHTEKQFKMQKIKEAYQRKDAEREKLRIKTLQNVCNILGKLSEEVQFEDAYIFGSVLEENRFSEHSDVDIAFLGLDRDELFYVTSYISGKIGRNVNIIHLEDISFKDKILMEGLRWKND